ncbi:hypothetical protein RHS01_08307 [Rhizoctonia solani]|uniref:Secreted protein n=1 Tax=Rhizoctonia solani TaxID=456999 RepID=A0A8H7I7Q1_9AGAM|nr:hypothetical protein RHS01_08307 [Rhizoctonia solani]
MRLGLLTAILPVMLALSALVLSAPVDTEKHVAARGGTSFANCPSGDSILAILESSNPNFSHDTTGLVCPMCPEQYLFSGTSDCLDDPIQANADPTEEIRNIIPLFNAATTKISDLPMDKPCVFDGEYLKVAEVCIVMLGVSAAH